MIKFKTILFLIYFFQIGVNIAGADGADSVCGMNSEGQPWSYAFDPETINQQRKKMSISLAASHRLLLSNDDWIVLGAMSNLGFGRAKTTLRFFDAKTLLEEASVSLPNAVVHVDWSSERAQFLAATTKGEGNVSYLKYPDDVAQALVLIDLKNHYIQRIQLWEETDNDDLLSENRYKIPLF